MYRIIALLIALLVASPAMANEQAELDQKSKTIIKTMVGKMQKTMKAAMKEGGPTNAIASCSVKAPKAAAKMSKKTGFDISRTSLKLRNPKNAPDAWEKEVLHRFEEQKQYGAAVGKMEYSEILTTKDGKKTYRFMKAIGTKGQCLICHGNPKGKVKAKHNKLYPQDQATGFKEGDISGAYTLSKAL